MAVRIQIRRDTAANWTIVDPILSQGEMGYETDTGFLKFGDGTTEWSALSYFGGSGGTSSLEDVLTVNNSAGGLQITELAEPTVATDAATKGYADALVTNLWNDRGNFDASGNAYPSSGGSGTAGAILKGDIWTISVAGILPSAQSVEIGDTVRALVNTPGNTQANWAIGQNNIGYVAENVTNKENTTLDSSTTKYPTNRLVKEYADAKVDDSLTASTTIAPSKTAVNTGLALKQALVNSAVVVTDASTMDLTAIKHTLSSSSATRTFTISYTGDDITLIVTLSNTAATYTFPATALCVSDGTSSGNNILSLSGVSGDKYVIAIKKIGSDYYVVSKNFGQ